MKNLKKVFKVAVMLVLIVGGVSFAFLNQKTEVVEYKTDVVMVDEKADIRNRADIKRQQELIVEEAFLLEEKAKFEASLKDVETRLDGVRKEKVSFVSPLKQSR